MTRGENFIAASSSKSWPEAQGTITRFEITTHDRKGRPEYRPNVEYRVMTLTNEPTGLDAFLYDLRNRHSIDKIAGGTIALGFVVSLSGAFRMIRYDS